jgi:phytoene synthase
MTEAERITKSSGSNLALAFIVLPKERRADASVFYAFCRIVDDIADDPGQPREAREAALALWRAAISGPVVNEPPLAADVRELIEKYRLPLEHFHEIIAGVAMDLAGAEYTTWEDLRLYCHRVASVVGLVSSVIFGADPQRADAYARALGLALQITNILRDVGEDFANGGRIYLPAADLAACGYSVNDLAAGRENAAWRKLADLTANRAFSYFAEAEAALPAEDRTALIPAEIMHRVYRSLLEKMRSDGYHVFGQRYRLSRPRKLWLVLRTLLRQRA